MPREKEGYRDQLERLSQKFNDRECITLIEACALLESHRETLLNDKTFPVKKVGGKYIVPIVGLARWLS